LLPLPSSSEGGADGVGRTLSSAAAALLSDLAGAFFCALLNNVLSPSLSSILAISNALLAFASFLSGSPPLSNKALIIALLFRLLASTNGTSEVPFRIEVSST